MAPKAAAAGIDAGGVIHSNTEEPAVRDDRWSEAIAVGSLAFVETVKNDLGVKARHRDG